MSEAQSLEQKREEAKAAFLATLASAQRNPNGKEIVEHLTRLLGNMEGLGGSSGMTGEDLASGFAGIPDLKDEFGNPIIEINEPMSDVTIAHPTGDSISSEPIQHLWDMPPELASARKREMDKMWAELEEEEEMDARRERILASRRLEPQSSTSAAEQAGTQSTATLSATSGRSESKRTKTKGVSFADGSTPGEPSGQAEEWGDLVPATLRNKRRQPITQATPVMRFGVVERTGKALSGGSGFVAPDSDDEEVDALAVEKDSDDEGMETGHTRDSDEDASRFDDAESEEESQLADTVAALSGANNAGGMTPDRTLLSSGSNQALNDDEFVPLDATPQNPKPHSTPSLSRFKAKRTGQSHSITVRALGPDAQEIIREGKVIDGKLVAPADSDSDVDGLNEVGKRTVEILRNRVDEDLPVQVEPSTPGPQSAKNSAGTDTVDTKSVGTHPEKPVVGEVSERLDAGANNIVPKPIAKLGKPSRFKTASGTSLPTAPRLEHVALAVDHGAQRSSPAPPPVASSVVQSSLPSPPSVSSSQMSRRVNTIMSHEVVERFP